MCSDRDERQSDNSGYQEQQRQQQERIERQPPNIPDVDRVRIKTGDK